MNIDPRDKMPNLSEKPDGVHPKLEKYILRKVGRGRAGELECGGSLQVKTGGRGGRRRRRVPGGGHDCTWLPAVLAYVAMLGGCSRRTSMASQDSLQPTVLARPSPPPTGL